jgi:hypothetical protein
VAFLPLQSKAMWPWPQVELGEKKEIFFAFILFM